MSVRYHLDEHIDPAVAAGLRGRGIDVTTSSDADLLSADDEEQMRTSMGTDIYLHAERRSEGAWQYCGELDDLESRNRQFFAILANVRNRSTEPFDYIVLPRGFPDDMSEELRREGLLFCGHDPGWVTLRELLDFDWDKPLKSMQRFSMTVYSDAQSGTGSRVTWVDTYKEAVGAVYLNELFTRLAAFGSPEDVRIVFSFDT